MSELLKSCKVFMLRHYQRYAKKSRLIRFYSKSNYLDFNYLKSVCFLPVVNPQQYVADILQAEYEKALGKCNVSEDDEDVTANSEECFKGSCASLPIMEIGAYLIDNLDPDPERRIIQWDNVSVQEMKNKFKAIGFGPCQLAVMSAFLGPDQLATKAQLAADSEVRLWVEKYRSRVIVSQTDYEVEI